MEHEELKDLLAVEAAGALAEDERRPLDAHLASCGECRRELRELRDAAAMLAYAVEPAEPPAHLRARVLERARTEGAAARPAVAAGEDGYVRPVADAARGAGEEARRLLSQLGLWDVLRARPALGFGLASAILLAAALGVATAALRERNRGLRFEMARLSERLTEAEAETARGREMLARTREVNELLTAPASRVEQLAGTKVAPRASARLAYDRETRQAVLVAAGLPPAPAGKAYQLWFISGGRPVPGGVFKINPDGRALLRDTAPAGLDEISAFAVTLEDEGGATAPRGEMYLLSRAS
jgi:anti-sigma-K factor RskA